MEPAFKGFKLSQKNRCVDNLPCTKSPTVTSWAVECVGLVAAAQHVGLVAACQNLVPQIGIKPRPPALGAQGLNHWAAWEVPGCQSLCISP